MNKKLLELVDKIKYIMNKDDYCALLNIKEAINEFFKCENCSSSLNSLDNYCYHCGKKTEWSEYRNDK